MSPTEKLNESLPRGKRITGYEVQFTVPVDNPVNNVRKRKRNGVLIFEVPINHPLAHSLTFSDLLLAVEQFEKFQAGYTQYPQPLIIEIDSQKRD